jgi:hypothetical protein
LNTGNVVFASDLVYSCIEFALAATIDKNISTLFYEPLCRGKAYAAAAACDDCTFPSSRFMVDNLV